MHELDPEFLERISGFLGGYYLSLAAINAVAAYWLWHNRHRTQEAIFWFVVAVGYVILAPLAMSTNPDWTPQLPSRFLAAANDALGGTTGPIVYSVGSVILLAILYVFRSFFVRPMVAWAGLNLTLLLMGLSITNTGFAAIVTKPDNVPIVGLVFLLGFFTWLSAAKAVANDERMQRGLGPLEKEDDEKVLVWPDLVYTEMICMIALTALLLVWAILLKAPLEDPASRVKTPNPSKAPWYFLGLQEMLVYYDPWYAGVVLPATAIFGLMAIPYMDFNRQGSGYYTIQQRQFSYLTFQFGFIVLWITLIILGTFLRGPNWNFFGPYEAWDAHKVEALTNRFVSEFFWEDWLGTTAPKAPPESGALTQFFYILWREWLGIVLLLGYFMLLPPLMAITVFRRMFVKMGFFRYMLLAHLLLMMATLPLKMVLRWSTNLKYVIRIPEYFFNF